MAADGGGQHPGLSFTNESDAPINLWPGIEASALLDGHKRAPAL